MPCIAPHPARTATSAFSLLELLVCMVIVAIVAVFAFPAYRRVRLKTKALVSVRNVRNMQLANIRYSADHDGWYVPYAADYSPETGKWGDQWLRNKDFMAYLGIRSFPHGVYDYPPEFLSPLATIQRLPDGYGPIQFSYGYNVDIYGGSNLPPKPIHHVNAAQIVRPGNLLAFADSVDWWISIERASNYQPPNSGGQETYQSGSIAYRYGGRAAVVFFDGHAELLDRNAVVGNKLLWLNQ